MLDKDEMQYFTTEYKTQAAKQDSVINGDLKQHYQEVTVAGKPSYIKAQRPKSGIVHPQVYYCEKIEERIKKMNDWHSKGWESAKLNPKLIRDPDPIDQDILEAQERERAQAL